jgi:hypothetical protein
MSTADFLFHEHNLNLLIHREVFEYKKRENYPPCFPEQHIISHLSRRKNSQCLVKTSLPEELSAFFGKWEWTSAQVQVFLIVEKIDEEKARLYIWRGGSFWPEGTLMGWSRYEAKVIKERGNTNFGTVLILVTLSIL